LSDDRDNPPESDGFAGLVRYTVPGYVVGVLLGAALDFFGFQTSAVGQWLVRTIAGEGESVLEGFYSLRNRLARGQMSLAEAYGWGKLLGMTFPWLVDWGSRAIGVDVYGIQGFYIPYFYGLSDQIGASISGMVFLRNREGSWSAGIRAYSRHPVMIAGLVVLFTVPFGLLLARILGFSPTTQTLTAFETIAANLCWVPPVVGWAYERRLSTLGEGMDN
jgi:hypothetical protein